jgi:Ribbon-helix-helix protein, copG family
MAFYWERMSLQARLPAGHGLRPARHHGAGHPRQQPILTALKRNGHIVGMARTSVKATYALDVATVQALERMARRWEVSKSEALRRAILAAAAGETGDGRQGVKALDRLQRSLSMTSAKARAWVKDVRAERRAGAARLVRQKRR